MSTKFTMRAIAGVVLTASFMLPLTAAAAEGDQEVQQKPEPPGDVTSGMLADSVTRFGPVITPYSTEGTIDELGGGESDEQDVLVLEADLLFRSNEWDLPPNAVEPIAELAEVVPEGASVDVHGHTDSLPVDESQFDFDNRELSENRAQAVADALAEERPDLTLNVEGFGDEQPAVREDPEDSSTFAANRRVELRYGD
ncbi:OmpA family protein [Nesterenkonia haasae]|uniref:OmpA family protein n=1 Tax=Nesterenkonia haasae TaxID=2587813 RepID=UPI00139172BB|nr:OmpA family protein [Nesterenkonia haasae]NDK31238.1 hypothetical protein [Nesterenkonia haasae]